jgi:hypothetical protein
MIFVSVQRVKRKEEMMRRVRSTDSGTGAAITRASSTGSSKNKDNIPIDDFIDQENLAGKYVIVTLAKEVENAQVKRAASIMRQHSLKRQPSLTRQPSSGFARAPSSSGFVRAPSFERADSASGISFTNVVDIISCLNGLGMMPACWRNSGVYLYTHTGACELYARLRAIACNAATPDLWHGLY